MTIQAGIAQVHCACVLWKASKTSLTCTDDSSILMMATVVLTPSQVKAQGQLWFRSAAFHIVQKDRARAVAKEGIGLGFNRRATSKLPAHYLDIEHVPVIITHRPPNGFVEDLYTTLAATVAIHHTDGWRACTRISRRMCYCRFRVEMPSPL